MTQAGLISITADTGRKDILALVIILVVRRRLSDNSGSTLQA